MWDGRWCPALWIFMKRRQSRINFLHCVVSYQQGSYDGEDGKEIFIDQSFLVAASLITPPIDVCKGNMLFTSSTNKQQNIFFCFGFFTQLTLS